MQTSCLPEKHSFTCTDDKINSELLDNNIFNVFLEHLEESNQIDDFINTITSIACNKLPITNLAWKSALYRGNWTMCSSMHSMQWDTDHIQFCLALKILFGSLLINVLRRPAHFGKVVDKIVQRNKYDPIYGKYNFAIPSAKTLQKFDVGYPKDIPCGMVEHTLDVGTEQLRVGKQFTLSFDG